MCLGRFLTISLFLLSLSAIGEEIAVPSVEVPIITRNSFIRLPERRPYSFDLTPGYDLSQRPQLIPYSGPDISGVLASVRPIDLNNISMDENFTNRLMKNSSMIYNRDLNCPIINIFDPANLQMITNVMGQCDGLASANRYDPQQSILSQIDNFRAICNCYDNPNSLQGAAANEARPPRINLPGRLFSREERITDQKTVILNVRTEAFLLQNLVEGVQLQASFLSSNINEAQRLSQAYAQNYLREGRTETEALRNARRNLTRRYREARFTDPPDFPDLEFNRGILTGFEKENSCVSERDFAAMRQFPPEAAFYSDLANSNVSTCNRNCDNWNFNKLKTQLENLTRGRMLTLDEAKTNPETSHIVRRLDFLHRNPLIKNFLSANMQAGEKEQVVQMIKDNFTGDQSTAIRNSDRFRNVFSRFMADPLHPRRVNEVKEEGQRQFNRLLRELPERATRTRHLATASDLVQIAPTFFENSRSETRSLFSNGLEPATIPGLIEMPNPVDVRARRLEGIGRICPKIQNGDLLNNSYVFNELERQWTREANEDGPDGSTLNLAAFQDSVCNQRRATPGGPPVNFSDWIATRCREDAVCRTDRRARVAEFVRAHPHSNSTLNPDPGVGFATLVENAPIIDLPEDAAQVAGQVGAQSATADRSATTRTLRGDFVIDYPQQGGNSSLVSRSVASLTPVSSQITAAGSTPSNASPATPQINTQSGQVAFLPQAEVPVTPVQAAIAQRDNLRSQFRQSETETNSIRDELAGLRETFQRENAQPPAERDDSLIRDLNERLGSLEQRLETKDRETADLRRRLARSERVVNEQTPVLAARAPDNSDQRSQVISGGTTGSSGTPQPGPQNGSQNVAPTAGSGASFQRGSGSTASLPSSVRSGGTISGNSALLSRYGVQSSSVQGGIVVANPSSEINYQELQTQSEGSIITLPVQLAEYNLIASNNQEALRPYLERCRALAGEVCRLNISAPGAAGPLEIYVVKNGNELSIVPSSGAARGIASDAVPGPVPAPERDRTLNGLRRELGQ